MNKHICFRGNLGLVAIILSVIILIISGFGLLNFITMMPHVLRGEYAIYDVLDIYCRELILFSSCFIILFLIWIQWKNNWHPIYGLIWVFLAILTTWGTVYYHFVSLIIDGLWNSLILNCKNEWYFPLSFILMITLWMLELAIWRKRKDMSNLFLTTSNHNIKST